MISDMALVLEFTFMDEIFHVDLHRGSVGPGVAVVVVEPGAIWLVVFFTNDDVTEKVRFVA